MNTIDLTNKRDYPNTTSGLEFLQNAYAYLENLRHFGGDNFILSGCVDQGASVTAGIVVLNGMIMPFAGGAKQTNIKIVRTVTTVTVGEGTRVQRTFHAEFGISNDSNDTFVWATINSKRFSDLVNLTARMVTAEAELAVVDNARSFTLGITYNGSGSVTSTPYSRYAKSTYVLTIQSEFVLTVGTNVTNPSFTLNVVAGFPLNTFIPIVAYPNGVETPGFAKITGASPLVIEYQGSVPTGGSKFRINTSIPL